VPRATVDRSRESLESAGISARTTQQLPIERAGRFVGLCSQLALQRLHALLVLTERRGPAALPRVEAHQGAMNGLLQRVQRQQPQGRLHRRLEVVRAHVMRQQLGERLERELAEPLALHRAPFLEHRLVDVETVQQIASIQRGRSLQRGRLFTVRRQLELGGVDPDAPRVQRDGVGPVYERRRGRAAEAAPQPRQRLAKSLARELLGIVAPQERGERLPGMRATGRKRETGEQRAGLPRRKLARPLAVDVNGEASEQLDPEKSPVRPRSQGPGTVAPAGVHGQPSADREKVAYTQRQHPRVTAQSRRSGTRRGEWSSRRTDGGRTPS